MFPPLPPDITHGDAFHLALTLNHSRHWEATGITCLLNVSRARVKCGCRYVSVGWAYVRDGFVNESWKKFDWRQLRQRGGKKTLQIELLLSLPLLWWCVVWVCVVWTLTRGHRWTWEAWVAGCCHPDPIHRSVTPVWPRCARSSSSPAVPPFHSPTSSVLHLLTA